jgi:uncharacterized protein (TIGR00369 family)
MLPAAEAPTRCLVARSEKRAMSETDAAFEQKRQAVLAFINEFPFFKLMGMKLLEIEAGRARVSMSWRADLCQPAGILHGGAIASLIDTAIAQSILLTLPDTDSPTAGGQIVSIDLRVKYLRPVSEGEIFCDARIVRPGRTILHTAATVTNAAGKDVALGDSIYMVIGEQQLKKRGA